jgi:hypothetical protein
MDSTLSINCGRRLARIQGGKYDDTVIYLLDKRKEGNKKCCDKCKEKCKSKCCEKCGSGCKEDKDNNDNYLSLKEKGEIFQQMPNNQEQNSDMLMIVGKRGAGKSYYLAKYLEEYIVCFPKNKIFMFSMCKDDKILNDLVSKRIDLDNYIDEGGLSHEDIPNNSCCIFDDIDVLDGKLKQAIYKLMGELIQLSRKRDITVITTSHLGRNFAETRHSLNGCSSYTFFYGSVSHQIKDTLKIYLGISTQNIKKILSLKDSRYCTIHTTTPPVVQTEKEIFILTDN